MHSPSVFFLYAAHSPLRVLYLQGDETRKVIQLQYTLWPDHGVPESASHLFAILDCMRHIRTMEKGMKVGASFLPPAWRLAYDPPRCFVPAQRYIRRELRVLVVSVCSAWHVRDLQRS